MSRVRERRVRRNRVLIAIWFCLLAISTSGSSAVGEDAGALRPAIRSGSEIDYPPFCIVKADGRADGFSVELMQAALSSMGRGVTFKIGPWNEVRGWMEKGEVQALPLVGRTPERETIFDFTFPYMSLHGAIVVRDSTKGIQNLEDLRGRRVAVMKGDNAEEFMRREDHGIRIFTTITFEEALRELSRGNYDAVVIQRLVALRLIQETGLTNLRIINQPIEGFRQDFCFAVRKGDQETLALLNEGLGLVIADGTYRHLHAKWFAALELPSDRPIIIGGDNNYPPFEYLDEKGKPAGYNVDLTRAIAKEVGIKIEIRLMPWAEIRDALAQGEIDAIQGMFYSPERDKTFDFTSPHIVNHYVSIVRAGEGDPPKTVSELAGKRIVVQQGDIMHDFALENGLKDQIAAVDSQEDALRELSQGKHDCALVSRLIAHYYIQKNGLNNLTVGRHPFLSPGYCYAVAHGNNALLSQLGEGLKIIDETGEYRRIYEKWMGVYPDSPFLLSATLRYVTIAAGFLLVLLFLVFLWSWSLRKQVASRTEALQKAESMYRSHFENVTDVIYSIDRELKVINVSPSVERALGYKPEEMINRPFQELNVLAPDFLDQAAADTIRVFSGERIPSTEYQFITREGTRKWGEVSGAPLIQNGQIVAVISVARDITERKQTERHIEHLNQVLRAIRDINQLIVREKNRDTLIQEGCRLLVDNRGYLSAMIVLTDVRNRPVSWAMAGLAESSKDLAAEFKQGRLPPCSKHALRQKGALVVNDRKTQCRICPIVDKCSESQSLCVPLIHDAVILGYLAASAENSLVLDDEEKSLFIEMAEDLAYALSVMNMEVKRKRGEDALRESEKKYHDMILNLMEGFYSTTPDGRLLEYNTEFTKLLKLDPEKDHAGTRIQDFWQDPIDRTAYLQELTEKGFVKNYEIKAKKSDGEKMTILASARMIIDGEGNPFRIEGSFLDITERRQAEEKLQASEKRIEDIVFSSSDWIWEVDAKGKYTFASGRVEQILGYTPEELIGKTPFEMMSEEDAKHIKKIFEKIAADKKPIIDLENRNLTKQGEIVYLLTNGVPIINENGELAGYRGMDKDITDRKKVEEEYRKLQAQLLQAQKMESVGRLAGGVAHDFNNMLSVILGNAELAMNKVDPSDASYRNLQEILHAAQRSADITRKLLAFARRQIITPQVLDLNEAIEKMLRILRRLIGENIDLSWRPGAGLWFVNIDPSQLDQILANLCINARDAITETGKLTIETDNTIFDQAYCADHPGFVPGEYVLLSVSDDGCGMDKETLSNLFEPFFTTKGIGKGTGLGLATVYGIIKQNKGFINIYSEPGKGTTFKIYLPRHTGEMVYADKMISEEIPAGQGETILIVEDEASILKLAKTMLERLGYIVLDAITPGQAISLVEKLQSGENKQASSDGAKIHLLLTDIVMPEMNGRYLSDKLRTFYPRLKTLFMSGYTANAIAHQGVLEEGVHFIQKPFSLNDIAVKIRAALDE